MSTAKRPGSGVIIREAHLQIDLRAQGYGRERLELEPTPSNIRYAERLRAWPTAKVLAYFQGIGRTIEPARGNAKLNGRPPGRSV